jgi:type II secretory pathway pseudopilin PulG
MKRFFRCRDGASKGAALLIALALVVLVTAVALAYLSRTTSDRQLAQSSYDNTSADLLARTALDTVVSDFKEEILSNPTITRSNIQPSPYPTPTPADIPNLVRYSSRNAAASRASNVSSSEASSNGRSVSTRLWNSHYLVPRGNPGNTAVDSSPVPSFSPPDWVLVTGQGPNTAPSPSAVIGRYAFAVYDEGGLLDMSLAGSPGWSGLPDARCSPNPSATPWLVNVGRKGIVALADLTALGSYAPSQMQIDNIVGWRNYGMTQRTGSTFGNFSYAGETDCNKQNFYGNYLLYFGDPPFTIESLSDKLLASTYPFTSTAAYVYPTPTPGVASRTDQALATRQQLLKLQSSLGFSQNILQYMGTFSRERNRPAPDWPNLSGNLSEGRFNMNNLALVIPNPLQCNIQHGQKRGWLNGKNKNKLCGTFNQIIELFGLFWVQAPDNNTPGHWKYINHTGPNPPGDPDPNPHSVICWRGANQQADFFQVLHYALSVMRAAGTDRCSGRGNQARTFGIGASLIDQYDSGAACFGASGPTQPPGCDLDWLVTLKSATHTTVIVYGQGSGNQTAYGMELNHSDDPTNGDDPCDAHGANPKRPSGAPVPIPSPITNPNATIVVNRPFSSVGDFGYGIDTSALLGPNPTCPPSPTPGPTATPLPTLDFSSPNFYDAPVLDFFSYNPISSAYPRAGIVNLYTRNAPVIAAILKGAILTEAPPAPTSPTPSPTPDPTPVISQAQAMDAANLIVAETQRVLSGQTPLWGSVTQADLTRAIAARLIAAGAAAPSWSGFTTEKQQSIARALAEMGQTRTWNLFIDVIAQTGKYKPNAPDLSGGNFVVEGEKRYWLHVALGRDLIQADGSPCGTTPGAACQVDVLGTQLEEVIE